MRRLKIDLADLEMAFEMNFPNTDHYLDLETGELVLVTEDIRWQLEQILEDLEATEEESASLAALLEQSDLPEMERVALLAAYQGEIWEGDRFLPVPQLESYEAYRHMEDFIGTVQDDRLRSRLWGAIQGRGAFRRFKDTLAGHSRERERWFAFKEERLRQEVLGWLASEGIEPIIEEQP